MCYQPRMQQKIDQNLREPSGAAIWWGEGVCTRNAVCTVLIPYRYTKYVGMYAKSVTIRFSL